MYDPAIGRWGVTDALSEKYFDKFNYVYVANNPIRLVDPNGMSYKSYMDETYGEGNYNYRGQSSGTWGGNNDGFGFTSNDSDQGEKTKKKESGKLGSIDHFENHLSGGGGDEELKSISEVAEDILENGIRRFIEYIQNPKYGPTYFLKSIDAVETSNSENRLIGFSLKTANWGHRYFGINDEFRHIIGAFLVSEKYGPGPALEITSANEYYGFLRHDIIDWVRGIDNGSAFQGSDFTHNRQGIILWQYFNMWRNGKIDRIFKD
jgi:hypothetical protein